MAQAVSTEYWHKRVKRVFAHLAKLNPVEITHLIDEKDHRGPIGQKQGISDYLSRELGVKVLVRPVSGKKCTVAIELEVDPSANTKLSFEQPVGLSVASYLSLYGMPEHKVTPLNQEQIAFVYFLAEEQGITPDEAFELLFYQGATSYYSSRRSLRRRLLTKWRQLHNMGIYPDYVLGYFTKAKKRIVEIQSKSV